MVKWLKSQLNYSSILEQVEPLTTEMKELGAKVSQLENKSNELSALVTELDSRIATYKEEYARLIAEAEQLKITKVNVQKKVSLR